MTRSGTDRRTDQQYVTYAWLNRKALWWLASVFVLTVGAALSISAQVTNLRRDVQEAQALGPLVANLTHEVQLLRKGQDSLVTLMTERERRPSTTNPLTNQ